MGRRRRKPLTRDALLEIIERAAQEKRTSLSLTGRRIDELPDEIGQLSDLQMLRLGRNRLASLPDTIGNLKNLQILDLSNNLLALLPETIGRLTSLQRLNLSRNALTTLPETLDGLTNLQSLNVSNNRLTALPVTFGGLSGLQSLDLSTNRLTGLPESIGQLPNLESLDLSGNRLESLPESVGQLTALRVLRLVRNRLETLPPTVGQMASLRQCDLRDNQLTSLPPAVGQLSQLRSLHLRGNHLESVPGALGQLVRLRVLRLGHNQLRSLPDDLLRLTRLIELDLRNNELSRLPDAVGALVGVRSIDISDNELASLPDSFGHLPSLASLDLSANPMEAIPEVLGNLPILQTLYLRRGQLTALPEWLGQMDSLRELYLDGNQLASLPHAIGELGGLESLALSGNQLGELPEAIGQMTSLQSLSLNSNQLEELPETVGQMTSLQSLDLGENQLSDLPPAIGQLSNLRSLSLRGNQLTSLPAAIGQLYDLDSLDLDHNQLASLPTALGQMLSLESLHLGHNQLSALPKTLGQLENLRYLYVDYNQLTTLPNSLGHLEKLRELWLAHNPLTSPPPAVVEQGTQAVLAYLRERTVSSRRQWVSKLLVVGQGGVGKTALLRSLREEPFDPELSTTHGIQIDSLALEHPAEETTMALNAWDFGGQEIYHATHQFFLTDRSLFVLVWNARHGYEQARLYYWLDAIQARAPRSPVIMVATHLDQRDADLPLAGLRDRYPQIAGHFEVSNKTGQGIAALRTGLAEAAASLPLMGELWPGDWLDAAEAIRERDDRYVTPQELRQTMEANGVQGYDAMVLAQWMHELGDILYFREDEELDDLVILKPQWVTEYISQVLESEEVIGRLGIFTREHMDLLWTGLPPSLRDHILRLMERFDLSYRTLENREISLVVERLPLDPPSDLEEKWEAAKETQPCQEISMRYHLNSIPAGVPTWFIARSHRFSTHTHWRNGALFAYTPQQRHLALARALPHDRCLELRVRGPTPQNFFALLKDGMELTLDRFPGLRIDRRIPCPGHNGQPCNHEFKYEQLLRRLEMTPPRYRVECPESLELLDVRTLLFGLDPNTMDEVLHQVQALRDENRERYDELLTLLQREFAKDFRREQSKVDSHCPNVFALRPLEIWDWREGLFGKKMQLQLYCQFPGRWHPTVGGGKYTIGQPAAWLRRVAPLLHRLATLLKYVTPLLGPWLGAVDASAYEDLLKQDIQLMSDLVEALHEEIPRRQAELQQVVGRRMQTASAGGASLRALRQILVEKDPAREWGGLKKVYTPEGHYLWLCEYHAREYAL